MIGPRRLLVAAFFILITASFSAASDIYIAQNATGASSGADCADAYSASFFNNSGNWGSGSGQIGPGVTVYLCGTVSSNLNFQSNGAAGGSGVCGALATACTPVILDGSQSGAFMNGYINVNTSYFIIQNVTWTTNYATNSSGQAVIQMSGNWSHGTIQNNHIAVENSAQVIFMFTGNDMLIQNNYLSMYSPSGDNFDTDGVDFPSVTNLTLQGNFIQLNISEPDGCGSASGGCHDDIIQTWQYNSNPAPANFTVRYNYFSNISPGATGPQNISFCMIEGTSGTNYIYGNVFYSTGVGSNDDNGCGLGPGTFYVNNNTFIAQTGNGGTGLASLMSGGGTVTAENNIFYRDSNGNSPGALLRQNQGSLTFDHNFFYSPSSGDFPSGCSGQTGDICTTSSTTAAGLFNNFAADDFSLASGSPAIGAGVNLGSPYNEGLLQGDTWPNPTLGTRISTGAWDMGAYESSGSGAAPSAPTALKATVN